MEKERKTTILTDEEGNEYELEVIKEFDYKDKKYAVLYEDSCGCDDDCDCDEECDDECSCGCHDEDNECCDHIYVMEITKTEDGQDEYTEVNEELMKEIIPVVEKELYPSEE